MNGEANACVKARRLRGVEMVLATGVLLVGISSISAQDSGLGTPQGRTSSGQETQSKPVVERREGQPMPDSGTPPSAVEGRSTSERESSGARAADPTGMESRLQAATGAQAAPEASDDQPPVEQTLSPAWTGGADQVPPNPPEASMPAGHRPTEIFLTLVLRITRKGESEVLSATEMPGPLPVSDQAVSEFLYEVTDRGETLTAQSLPNDPFQAHSFGGGPGDPPEHHFEPLTETTVVVHVPKRSLDSPLEGLEIRLLALEPGPPVERMSVATVDGLKRERRLRPLVAISGAQIGAQVREKGTRQED